VGYNTEINLQEIGWRVDWIDLAQDRGKWGFLMITVMNFQVSKMWEISWLAEEPSASQEWLSSTVG
jgi:hypothetical protein